LTTLLFHIIVYTLNQRKATQKDEESQAKYSNCFTQMRE